MKTVSCVLGLFCFLGALVFNAEVACGQEEVETVTFAPLRWLDGSENSDAYFESQSTDDGSETDDYGPIRYLSESVTNELDGALEPVAYDEEFSATLSPGAKEYYLLAYDYRISYDRYIRAMKEYEYQYGRANREAGKAEKDVNTLLSADNISSSDADSYKTKAKGYISTAQDYQAAVEELDAAVAELDKLEKQLAELRAAQSGTVDAKEYELIHLELELQL